MLINYLLMIDIRWTAGVDARKPRGDHSQNHRAKHDVYACIERLRFYKSNIFESN